MDDDTSRMVDLASAWPEEDEDSAAPAAAEPEPVEEAEPESVQEQADELEPVDEESVVEDKAPAEDVAEVEASTAPSPSSWSATAREHWKKIPKEAQKYIQQREAEMQNGMQKNAEMARRAEGMDSTLQPYQQYFAMNGGTGNTLKTLLETGAGLQMGTPQQKAEIVSNIINQYGVDVAALDNVLVGNAVPPEVQQQSQIQQAVNAAVAPYQQQQQQLQQQQYQQQQRATNEVATEVDQFSRNPANEFYTDVRGDMADIMDMANNRGVDMSMQDAYNKACALNPEISRITQARQQQKNLAPKRRAAASISGSMGGPGGTEAPDSMRAAIASAWDNAGQV